MKYIGPFFRMNSLSIEEITGQLFHLSKEAIKTITLNSKCGIVSSFRTSKKSHSNNDISILSNFSPVLCLYKKSSSNYIHNKNSCSFDQSSFRKTINPTTNALMTLSLIELSDYYTNYTALSRGTNSLEKPYSVLAKKQLEFYSNNLRNSEGVFVEKKNLSDNSSKGYNLIDNKSSFKFSDQAFMMNAYYIYALYNKDDSVSEDYKNFALEILDMIYDYKDELYNNSFDECCHVLLALNILFDYEPLEKCESLIIDLSDLLINKFEEKDYYTSSVDYCALLDINLYEAYKHTNILYFKEKGIEIIDKLESMYDSNKGIFIKASDKKDVKYSSLEICFYFLSLIIYSSEYDNKITYNNMISNLYRRVIVNSGIICSWPEAPTLDEIERYKKLSLNSEDMINELFFRMPNTPTPESTGLAPVFVKNINYSRKKDSFSINKTSFDSNKNMLIFYSFIHYLRNFVEDYMDFNEPINSNSSEEINENNNTNNNDTEIKSLNDETLSIENNIEIDSDV